jgi:AcrR family transcriptional regulator
VAPPDSADASSERGRICAALLELVGDRGYSDLAPADLQHRAGVDQSAFQRHFADLEDCFAAVWDEVDRELDDLVFPAFCAPSAWRDRMRAALDAGLRFLASDDAKARLYVSEAVFAGEALHRRRQVAMRRLTTVIDLGRGEAPDPERVPRQLADALAGALWHHANHLIRGGKSAALPATLPELLYLIFLPYLGVDAAREEMRRPSG